MVAAVSGNDRNELEARTNGTLRVVFLGDRCAPDGHDGIANELLDDTAIAGDDGSGKIKVARQDFSYLLGVSFLRELREADKITEEHRDVTELGGGRGRVPRRLGSDVSRGRSDRCRGSSDRRPAVTTEPVLWLELRATRRTGGSQRTAAVPAEPFAVRVLAFTR